MTPNIGMCFDRSLPARAVVEFAESLDEGGVDQLWLIEDCFFTAGVSLAATALARTERLHVGIGILPAVARNAAVTAMEIATLAELAPGRVIAGIGHGVQEWMEQMGARPSSPLATLEEVLTTVRQLLRGETVNFEGQHVTLRDVTLDQPPAIVPPVIAGVRGPKSLAMAGRVCDGVVLADGVGPTYVGETIRNAGSPNNFRVSVFSALCLAPTPLEAYELMTPYMSFQLTAQHPSVRAHPHFDEMVERFTTQGDAAIADFPAEWWTEIGAIGDRDAVLDHIEALGEAGVTDVGLFPGPTLELARKDLAIVREISKHYRNK
ncbi:MAG: 5,10-methylenetetrahydromethanopterin reductase [Minisyncoccia bacterium]|jgi:5,10-methylenetetrahydromethanopterin reductase